MRNLRAAFCRTLQGRQAESIITSAKRIVKFREADEKSEGSFSQKATGDLGEKNIITAGEQNVKSEEVDEKPKDNSLQERSMDPEIIITDVKRNVKFVVRDENSVRPIGEKREFWVPEYHHRRERNCKIGPIA